MITRIAQRRKSKCSKSYPKCSQAPSPEDSNEDMARKIRGSGSTRVSFGFEPLEEPLPSWKLDQDIEPLAQKSIWWGRLRPRKEVSGTAKSPSRKPQSIVQQSAKGPIKITQSRAIKGPTDRPEGLTVVLNAADPPKLTDSIASNTMPVGFKPGRRSKRLLRLSDLSSTAQPQSVHKPRGSRRSAREAQGRGGDSRSREPSRLLTPPESK